ncbi:Plant organelle RNA recognition domain [Sesbania bispinosa]|nr:Plant organelle RNA recognition domain [Sesbania bispinosa]
MEQEKRVHELEVATEKWKIVSKIVFLMELLKQEPEMVIPVRSLAHYRKQINLPKPHRISDFLRKTPKLFELYNDSKGVLWCGLTQKAEDLMEEQQRVIEEHTHKAAEHVTRFLMMSVDKRLPLDKIAHFRRDFGLPLDFRTHWVHQYPQQFRVVKTLDDFEFLELVSWNPAWAITELEKKVVPGITEKHHLAYPRFYLSPYADAKGLKAGSLEFDKRAVAVMHELLSFTIEKRLVTSPHSLPLGASDASEADETSAEALGRKKKFEAYSDMSDVEGDDDGLCLLQSDSEVEDLHVQLEQQDTMDYEDPLLGNNSEMDVGEIA